MRYWRARSAKFMPALTGSGATLALSSTMTFALRRPSSLSTRRSKVVRAFWIAFLESPRNYVDAAALSMRPACHPDLDRNLPTLSILCAI